ncbi:MAG: choice-of-anchor J domain-containing protein, partial [Bacteroidales bacterium]|nr:choice-of-anchor J domain-containing protein [Bacteroidales bacterium]
DDITIGEASKGANDRAFSHYRVYRTNCYQESPYTEENTVVLACELQDTVYIDVSWPDAAPGIYKYGVGVVYTGNRGQEIAGPIHWANVTSAKANVSNAKTTFTDAKSAAAKGTRANNELTIFDGTDESYYLPVFTLYGDELGAASQFVIPASELSAMNGSTITSMKFYSNGFGGGTALDATWKGFVKEVNYTEMTQFEDPASGTEIYNGIVTVNNDEMVIDFNTPYVYNGGNLLIGFENIAANHYLTVYFLGQTGHPNAGMYRYRTSATPSVVTAGFLPKTTFTYQGGGSNTHEPIQEPRESQIVWSNCIDKDMFMDNVDITVLLNSADSPEGTLVTLFNLNDAEADLYPVEPVILDETGFYAWDQFRRGDYAVNVSLDGYEPIHDTVSIWDETHLRYVLTEILAPLTNPIYVSRTGWAMWEGETPGPTPVDGDEWAYSFDNGFDGWTTINADGDDHNWYHSNDAGNHSTLAITSHTGAGHMMSESYCNSTYGALHPDEYLVAPAQSAIVNGSTFSFWACAQDENYAAEHFGVAISTTGNTNAADFTTISEWTMIAKGGRETNPAATRNGEGTREGNWYNYSVDLSAYAGQNVWIAIRHFNCSDQFILCMDDAQLAIASKAGDRHFQYYKVMCTSIDGVPIFNHNTVYPFCQLDTNDPYQAPLVEGDHYLCKVAIMYSTGMSAWTEPVEWVYEPCEHWGPVDFVELVDNNEGNHIHWEFENGFNPYDPGHDTIPPTPVEGEYIQYCTETFSGGVGTGGGEVWWAIKFPATSLASYVGQNITKLGVFTDVDGDYGWTYSGNYELSVYAGATAPTTFLSTVGNQYVAGDLAWHDFVLQDPVAINGTQDLWIVGHTLDIAYPMSGCDYVGEPNSDYLSLDGSTWEHAGDYGLSYSWMLRAYVEQSRGGIEAFESGMVGNTYAFNITDIANFDERVFFLHNLMNDGRFNVINGEAAGMFVISATDDNMDLEEAVNDFIFNNANEFAMMDKVQAAQVANAYKSTLPFNIVNSMMMDIYAASRENNLCELALPFCTDNGLYEFPAGVNAGSGENGPDYDCLYTTPNPAWYYMKIADPGDMDIYMYSTPGVDIDFCCWGPFDDPSSPCPNGLTYDKVVSCSYSAQPTENCMIPASAQTGEYYILVITNYSNQACNINFSKVSGSGSTDCGILPPVDIIGFLITRDGEYLAFVGPYDRDYTDADEYGDHVYCVRPIYPGEQNLPDHNYGWSMGCPVCTNMNCAAPSHLEGTYEWRNGQYGALISWVTDTRDIVSFNIYRSNDGVNYEMVGSIDGNKTEYFDAVEVGTYFYQVTAISDCGESVPALTANGANFVIVTVTGIDENGGVAMYPNPTNGNVKIVANAMNHITVVSALGQVVYDMDVDCDEMNLNMAQFNAGIYTVRIATESGISVQRLTVVR